MLHRSHAEQFRFIDSLMYKYPESERIKKLDELVAWAEANNDKSFADELNIHKYQYVMMGDRSSERLQELTDLIANAHEKKDVFLEALGLELLGDYWKYKNKHSAIFENYLASYNIYSKLTPEQFPAKREYMYMIACEFSQNGDSRNAEKLFKEASLTPGKSEYTLPINNAIALMYRNMGNYDSAELYYQKIYADAIKRNDTGWIGLSAGNIGICYYYQKRYNEAIPLIEKDIEMSYATHQIQNAIHSSYILADIYFNQHDYGKSEELLRAALAQGESKPFWPQYQLAAPIFELLSKLYAAKNDMRLAYLYLDSATVAKDSLAAQFNELNVVRAKEKLELVQHQMEKQQLIDERKQQLLIRNGLILVIFLAFTASVLFVNWQRVKKNKVVAEKESELKMATVQLEGFRQSMQEKNNMIEQFAGELEKLKAGPAEEETTIDILTQLQSAIILTDEQWEHFRLMFEKVHKNFFVKLKDKFPGLSQAEIRFLALTKLKLSSKEMASMLGISPNAIRMYRYRLRKKLDLDKEDMIEPLIEQI